jgi:hypothetical protein
VRLTTRGSAWQVGHGGSANRSCRRSYGLAEAVRLVPGSAGKGTHLRQFQKAPEADETTVMNRVFNGAATAMLALIVELDQRVGSVPPSNLPLGGSLTLGRIWSGGRNTRASIEALITEDDAARIEKLDDAIGWLAWQSVTQRPSDPPLAPTI